MITDHREVQPDRALQGDREATAAVVLVAPSEPRPTIGLILEERIPGGNHWILAMVVDENAPERAARTRFPI